MIVRSCATHRRLLVASALALAAAGCARTLPPPADPAARIPARELAAEDEQAPTVLQASELLSPELLRGTYYEVDERVRSDGLVNTYVVRSPYGSVDAVGDDQLRYRENEFEVLGALDEYGVTRPMIFGLGLVNGAQNYAEGALQLIVWPARSLANVPQGAYTYGSRIAEMTREQRSHYEDSYFEELIGFSQSKRELAGRTGVDVYSTNPALQERFDSLSWPSWAGGILATVGTAPVPGAAGYALTATGTPESMHLVNLDSAPEDLRIDNRRKLKEMGVGRSTREALLNHPWYSPRHRTIFVDALYRLDGTEGRPELVRAALAADSEPAAFRFQRQAELLLAYHEYVSKLRRVQALDGSVLGRAEDGSAVVPLQADFGLWVPRTQALLERLQQAAEEPPPSRKVLWITGRLSPEMTTEVQARGWQVEENIFQRHLLAYEYQELMAIKDALYGERILPRIGD